MAKVVSIRKKSDTYMKQGYEVLEVPVEHKSSFELDIQSAIMNIAGISISNTTRFISYEHLSRCYRQNNNTPFNSAIITTGMDDQLLITDFFNPEVVTPDIYSRPIFIHIDTSLTGDRTGISAIAVMGYKTVNRYSVNIGDNESTKELYYHHIFTVGIQCPAGSEISFQKTRDFIYYLRYQLGWNIRGISTDGFQSADTRQQLITMGFENVDCVSLDKKPDGYLVYKSVLSEQRISHLYIPELEFEIINLARDNMTGKIDHDIDKCFTGDTKIRLVDGRDLTILELMQEQEYKTNWVYTFNEDKKIIEPKPIKKVFQTMLTKKLVKVTLDNGEVIKCTPNHRFMLRSSEYERAQNLIVGVTLKSINDKIIKVINIENILTSVNVYDLEIQDNHNFALSAGVFVHNSKDMSDSLAGAIYNASINEQDLSLYLSDTFDIIMNVNDNSDTEEASNPLNNLTAQKFESVDQIIKQINPFDTKLNDNDSFFFL